MRCAKCGYVSFDYLSECKKCRTSLASSREGLGFFAAKPVVPSLLGSLLSDYEPPVKLDSGPVTSDISAAFDIADGFGGGLWQAKPESGVTQPAPAIAHPDGSQEDFSLLDLSDEELELLIDKGPFLSGTEQAIGPESGSCDTRMNVPGLFSPAEREEPPDCEIGPIETPLVPGTAYELGDALTQPDDELQTDLTGGLMPQLTGEPQGLRLEVPKSDSAEFVAPPEQAEPNPDESTDDFVIELSENDLETLLKELNSTTKGEYERGSKR